MKKETHGPAVALKMTPITGPTGLLATGSDVALIDVEAIDAEGRRCLTYYGKVDFKCAGPATWLGGYNSGKEKTIHQPFLDLECGINRVAVRSSLEPGTITVAATADGISAATLSIESQSAGIKNGMTKLFPPEPEGVALQALPLPDPNDLVKAAVTAKPKSSDQKIEKSELIGDLIYTGPASKGADIVRPTMGQSWFTDISIKARFIHPLVVQGEQIRLPNQDWDFWAADVIGFTAQKDIWVYVAHNEKLPDPGWLIKEYEKVDGAKFDLLKGNYVYQLYRKAVKKGDEVTIGGATDDKSKAPAQGIYNKYLMYMVFVVDQKVDDGSVK
jgi:beta-galactosidase